MPTLGTAEKSLWQRESNLRRLEGRSTNSRCSFAQGRIKTEPTAEIPSEVEGPGKFELVEAAGVEPASENVTGQEPTCVVQFMPQALPWDVRGARSERTRNAFR